MMSRRLTAAALAVALLVPATTAAEMRVTHSVASDGSGAYDSISAAIAAAEPYDEILIAPGTYVDNLYIDKPLTLTGDGAREEIVILQDQSDPQVIEMEPDGPSVVTIYVDDVDVTIERVSIMDEDDRYTSILLDGGVSTIRDIHANDFVGIRGDAFATIEDSYIERLGAWGTPNYTVATGNEIHDYFLASEGARGRLEGNTVVGLPAVIESGASFEIIDNTFRPRGGEYGIVVAQPGSTATITGNTVEGGYTGILLEFAGETLVEGNTVTGSEVGVISVETPSTISGNTVTDAVEVGVIAAGDGATIAGNDISGGRIGIQAHSIDERPSDVQNLDAPPRIVDNDLQDVGYFGIVVEDSAPFLEGNTICAGQEAFRFVGDADPDLGTNEVCEAS